MSVPKRFRSGRFGLWAVDGLVDGVVDVVGVVVISSINSLMLLCEFIGGLISSVSIIFEHLYILFNFPTSADENASLWPMLYEPYLYSIPRPLNGTELCFVNEFGFD